MMIAGFDWATFWESMSSSAQASISVILVMVYGFVLRKMKWISSEGENTISHLGTTIFLPALLFSEIGPLATVKNIANYWPIIPLSLFFQVLSLVVAGLSHWAGMPEHYVPLFVFNNLTSLPLLLIDTLGSSGSLNVLLSEDEKIGTLVSRGKSYILVNSLVGNLMRFALGPYLMKTHKNWVWSHPHHDNPSLTLDDDDDKHVNMPGAIRFHDSDSDDESEHGGPRFYFDRYEARAMKYGGKALAMLKKALNPPLIGGTAALVCGLIPFLHQWLFEGGWLSALSDSLKNIGNLFSALQMFVIGAHLYTKRGSSASIPILVWLFAWRFFILPTISIAMVYRIRQKWPNLMESDPLLDFVLMTGNAGPPALTLSAIADLAHVDADVDGQISRIITMSYIVTPLIAFPITGALTVIGLYKSD